MFNLLYLPPATAKMPLPAAAAAKKRGRDRRAWAQCALSYTLITLVAVESDELCDGGTIEERINNRRAYKERATDRQYGTINTYSPPAIMPVSCVSSDAAEAYAAGEYR